MKISLKISAALAALMLALTGCGDSNGKSKTSEIDITSEIFAASSTAESSSAAETTTTTTTTTTVTETEPPEETEEPEESEEESSEEVTEETESEPESEPEPEENAGHTGGETIFKGLDYSFRTYNDTWYNEQDNLDDMIDKASQRSAEMGIDEQVQDQAGANAYDAVYSYVPDKNNNEAFISNFNVIVNDFGEANLDLNEIRSAFEEQFRNVPGYTLTSSDNVDFNGRNALKFIVSTSVNDIELKMSCYVFKNEHSLYQVTLSSTTDRYDKVEQAFNEIIPTFSFS